MDKKQNSLSCDCSQTWMAMVGTYFGVLALGSKWSLLFFEGTPLYAAHFRPGQIVDVTAKTYVPGVLMNALSF